MRIFEVGNCNQNVDVSVVIPTYNRVVMLEEAIRSIQSQTYEGIVEVIVVDDNSQDGTAEIIQNKYPSIRLIRLEKNIGPSAARNKGILAATGSYIAFLDSDDLWDDSYLEEQVKALERALKEDTKVFCVSGICIWNVEKDTKNFSNQMPHPVYLSPIHHLLSAGSFVNTPSSVIIPRTSFDEIGLFDENLRFAEDTDLYIRFLLAGYTPIFSKRILSIRRKHKFEAAVSFENIFQRLENRISIARRYYPKSKKDQIPCGISRIYGEIYCDFASQSYHAKHFGGWVYFSSKAVRYISFIDVAMRMKGDLSHSVRKLPFFKKS